jgi:hypothetical protein
MNRERVRRRGQQHGPRAFTYLDFLSVASPPLQGVTSVSAQPILGA